MPGKRFLHKFNLILYSRSRSESVTAVHQKTVLIGGLSLFNDDTSNISWSKSINKTVKSSPILYTWWFKSSKKILVYVRY